MAWNDQQIKKRFSFKCPMQWDEMDCTDDEHIRYCHKCEKNVFEVDDQASFEALAKKGACVSLLLQSGEEVVSAPEPPDDHDRLTGPPAQEPTDNPGAERLTGAARPAWTGFLLPLFVLIGLGVAAYFLFG